MELQVVDRPDGVTQLSLVGRLDVTGLHEVDAQFHAETTSRQRPAIVDLGGLEYIASLGMGMLISCASSLKRRGHDVALYLYHQANIRIISAATEQMGIPADKVFNNLQRYGNTSGGSIPIALDEALQAGRISHGDTALMCGFGAGLSWGTALIRW